MADLRVKRSATLIVSPIVWIPTDIPGCVLWLRSDLAWKDAAKTQPCTTDEDLIYVGEDKSGLVHDVIQATSGSRPKFYTNQINGHPAWKFDGLNNSLAAVFTLNVPQDIYIVFKQVGWVEWSTVYDGIAQNTVRLYQHATTPTLGTYSGAFGPNDDALAVGVYGLLQTNFQVDIVKMRTNGANLVTADVAGSNATGFILAVLGGGIAFFSLIDVAEVTIYDSSLSDTNRQRLELYFNTEAQGTGYAIY